MTAEPKAETAAISWLRDRITKAINRPLTITIDKLLQDEIDDALAREREDADLPEQWMDEGDTPVAETK